MSAASARCPDDAAPLPADLLDAWCARTPAPGPRRHLAAVASPGSGHHHDGAQPLVPRFGGTPPSDVHAERQPPVGAAPPVAQQSPVGSSAPVDPRASLIGRAASLFVAPRLSAEPTAAVTRFAPRVAVLGSAADAPPVAAALAHGLRRQERAPAAVVLTWPAEPAAARPAAPAASRLAARLAARGHLATPRGRLAWLTLAEPPVPSARRLAGTVEEPLVVALGGPRTDDIEELLREQDLVAVVARDPDGPLARIALGSLDVTAVVLPPLTGATRRLALAGLSGARITPSALTVDHTLRGER
jgi:hypothetical protein